MGSIHKRIVFSEDVEIERVEDFSAIQLFIQCAKRIRGNFVFADEQAHVVRICQMVEGVPLAIELAAAFTRVLSSADIALKIEQKVDFLTSNLRNIEPRHRSMVAVFKSSFELLSPNEREVFKRLSVFRGGFRQEAAEQVAGASLTILIALIDKSLLRREKSGRYNMHELLRQYAEEELNEMMGALESANDGHCEYFSEFLHERESDSWVTNDQQVHNEIGAELDNIRRALEWAVEQRNTTQLMKAVCAFTVVCYRRGLWQEGYNLYDRIVALSRSIGNDGLLWWVLASQGWFAHCLSDFEQAARLYEEALTIGRQSPWHGHARFKNFLTLRLSETAMRQGDLVKARQYVEELEADTYLSGTLWRLETQGRIEYLDGNYEHAKKVFQEALTVARTFRNQAGMAVILNRLGYVYLAQGEYMAAKEAFRNSLERGQGFDYFRSVVQSLVGLGFVAYYLEESDVAWSYFSQSLENSGNTGDVLESLNAIIGVAQLLATDGREARALELLVYARQHPGADWEAREQAGQLLNMLESNLSAETVAKAGERAKMLDLKAIVDSILAKHPAKPRDDEPTTAPPPKHIMAINQSLPEPLTGRELEVLELIASGHSNRQIADQLVVGVSTVKKHITHIFGKLGIGSRTQAIHRARELNLF